MAEYDVYLYSNTGAQLACLTKRFVHFSWQRVVNDLGNFTITLSDETEPVDRTLFMLNGRVAFYRKAAAFETPRLELVGFIRNFDYQTDERGTTRFTFSGPDQNDLLQSRLAYPWHPYSAGFWHPNEYAYADTALRLLVEDNLGAGSSNPTARDLVTSNSAGLTIAIESSATTTACTTAGQMWLDHSGGTLLQVCRGIADSSKTFKEASVGTAAVPVYFDMATDTDTSWTFRVYTTRRGMNHRADSGQPVYIGLRYGNLMVPRWVHDRTQEVNAVLGVKIQDPSAGDTAWALDETRIGEAPLNRREMPVFTSEEDTSAEPHKLLNENKPKPKFTGRIQDTPGCRYGVHWGFGDELSIDYLDKQYNVKVTGVSVEMYGGFEKLEPTFEVQDT